MYEEEIENDIATLRGIGIPSGRWDEIQRELATRLKGNEQEEGGDDQLLGKAVDVPDAQWRAKLGQ